MPEKFSDQFEPSHDAVTAIVARLHTDGSRDTPWRSGDPGIAQLLWSSATTTSGLTRTVLLEAGTAGKAVRFHGAIYPVSPLYVSSICAEQCRYCNYRGGNRGLDVVRRRLTDHELTVEAEWLADAKGLRCIELVYASDPMMRPDVIARHVKIVRTILDRRGGGVVGLSAEPAEAAEYAMLKAAGLDFAVVWMETYDRDRWAKLHPGRTRKADMTWRLDAYDRMIAGGLKSFGMGVLSGLSGWRRDWAMLLQHEAYLMNRHGIGAAILGIPRLKPAPGAPIQQTAETPTDDELRLAVAVHNLFSPQTLPFVSTREDWDLCTQLAAGGGCLFTFNCSTIPGGYTLQTAGRQFPSFSFDATEYVDRLPEHGLTPEFNWRLPESVSLATVRSAR